MNLNIIIYIYIIGLRIHDPKLSALQPIPKCLIIVVNNNKNVFNLSTAQLRNYSGRLAKEQTKYITRKQYIYKGKKEKKNQNGKTGQQHTKYIGHP